MSTIRSSKIAAQISGQKYRRAWQGVRQPVTKSYVSIAKEVSAPLRIDGTITIPAPPEKVFKVFTDRDALRRATPGCESLEETALHQFEAVLKIGVASITGTYKGKLELQDVDAPRHYKLVVQGQGSPGYMQGTASFDFAPAAAGTTVTYVWDIQVGGLVASVGQRVLGGVGKMLIGQFMTAMAKELAET